MSENVNPHVVSIERILAEQCDDESSISEARRLLREYLSSAHGRANRQSTLGEIVASLAYDTRAFQNEAACLIRYLSVRGFLPENNNTNNLYRNIVTLAESSLPAFCNFFKIPEKKQTYEKIEILEGAHSNVKAILAPLRVIPGEINAVLNAKQKVLSILNHGAVRAYCEPFGIAGGRAHVETLLTRFARLDVDSEALSMDVREAQDAVDSGKKYCNESFSFLTQDYLKSFFINAEAALKGFVVSARGRLSAQLHHRLSPDGVLLKRYPLLSEGREISFSIPLKNLGPGRAMGVKAQIETDGETLVFEKEEILLGNIPAGDFSLVARAMVITPAPEVSLLITLRWTESASVEVKELVFECNIRSQVSNVDWKSLAQRRPYTLEIAKGDAFVGRVDQVRALATKILQNPMEPFYVTGQKRVGKSSLALAALDSAKENKKDGQIYDCYCLWGEFAYSTPAKSIKALGEAVADTIVNSLPIDRAFAGKLEYEESLADLVRLARNASKVDPGAKYVIIIDEFDEIHQELYLHGNLAETFFANLRALSTLSNVCVALVGGENMPFVMDRQGQKLNKFVRVGLDYFSRDREWKDFMQLVRKPSEDSISWHEEAISEIFNFTNGNPYFSKLVCAEIYATAVRERDADLTSEEVLRAVSKQVARLDTNSFAHLWQDGIHKAVLQREPDILRRKRLLVAVARIIRAGKQITLENIIAECPRTLLLPSEVLPVLNEFVRRRILKEEDGIYEFVLPIFRLWLSEVGISQLVSDAVEEELAQNIQIVEERSYVTATELEDLTRKWPPYQGKYVRSETVRAWLDQVDTNRKRRLLFKLLRHVRFFDEQKIRTSLRTAHGLLIPELPRFVQKKRSHRRLDVVVTYIDGEGKSGQYYASKYAEENKIGTQSILSPISFGARIREYEEEYEKIAAIVIVDDIVATGKSWANAFSSFVQQYRRTLSAVNVPINLIALTATNKGEQYVRDEIAKIDWLDADLRVCDSLLDENFAFAEGNGIWESGEEAQEAIALCRDLGAKIYQNNPLGFGNQGLLVVFPDTCPNNTLPILHSYAKEGSGADWFPLFPRLTN